MTYYLNLVIECISITFFRQCHRTKREQREEFDISIKIFIGGAGGQKV
jgi:hypothetical protein